MIDNGLETDWPVIVEDADGDLLWKTNAVGYLAKSAFD